MNSAEANSNLIVGLAGGLLPNGDLPSHVESRVIYCTKMALTCSMPSVLFSSCYTLNKPPILNEDGYPLSEASAMAKRAAALGCEAPILCEQQSHDTIGSAYFVFLHFVEIWRPSKLHVVTSSFHMPRTEFIFSHVAFLFDYPFKDIAFLASDTLKTPARERAEMKSLVQYKEKWAKICDRRAFGRRLFEHHQNYNSNYNSRTPSANVLQTY